MAAGGARRPRGPALTVLAGLAACSVSDELPQGKASEPPGPGPTTVCETECVPIHGAGEADYRALRSCLLCDACAEICESQDEGICEAANESGCSAEAADCQSCIGSPCAFEQLPNTTFAGVCAETATVCAGNPACVALNNCVSTCVATGGAGGAGGAGGGV